MPVSRPAVSQHLRVLKDARFGARRREGARRIYELNPEGWRCCATTLPVVDQALSAFKSLLRKNIKGEEQWLPKQHRPPQ